MEKQLLDSKTLVEDYLFNKDWRTKENSNAPRSFGSLNKYIIGEVSKNYWLNEVHRMHPSSLSCISSPATPEFCFLPDIPNDRMECRNPYSALPDQYDLCRRGFVRPHRNHKFCRSMDGIQHLVVLWS